MRKRLTNFEALRIAAMLFVVVLHYLNKGNQLTPLAQPFGKTDYAAWLIESFAIVAVNVYVLISGYFLCKSTPRFSRMAGIVCQTLWYSLLIPLVLAAVGRTALSGFSTYDWLGHIFPLHMNQYWFVTSYIVLMLLAPFLNAAVCHMDQTQLGTLTALLVAFETLPKSVLPVKFTFDGEGYDILWFVCLYLTAAYIRFYGIQWFRTWKRSLIGYGAGCLLIFAGTMFMRFVYFRWDAFGDNMNFTYHYNHIFTFFAAVSLFYTFSFIQIKEGRLARIIQKTAPYTFGVYLIHEHILIRYDWPQWLGCAHTESLALFLWNLLWKPLFVLAVCMLLDWVRSRIFAGIGRGLAYTPLPGWIEQIDKRMQG